MAEAIVAGPSPWVLIPVKDFDAAKSRLSPALEPAERARLAREMATHVVLASAPLRVAVVCDDETVAEWARAQGAAVIWRPGTGLNTAVQQGVEFLASQGVAHVIVAHSDLPFASRLAEFAPWPGITIVPDRHGKGSNVVSVPTDAGFQFSYGTDSFSRHVAEAARLRRGIRIVHEASLSWDIDYPADLLALNGLPDRHTVGRD